MHFSDVECGKRLFLGTGRPIALGIGKNEIRGSAYLEGPVQMGTADAFSSVLGTLMIARDKNTDNKNQPPRHYGSKVILGLRVMVEPHIH